MSEITTIGLDLAKHVFQVHGIDAEGTTVLRKRLRRGQVLAFFSRIPRCVVGLEACATAHYWARELGALGHEVRLMPAQYVKAYIKRNKHDAADAEAICEAVQRPTMRFVPVKTTEQQAAQLLHRRLLLCRLDRHKSHRRALNSLANRFGIGGIVLIALDVRLHVLRRHQPHLMAKRAQLARPVVRRRTRFQPNHTAWKSNHDMLRARARARVMGSKWMERK